MFNYFVQIVTNRYVQATAGLLGLLIGFYSIYLTFNYSKKTDISYQLVSDSYVIEIKEKLSKLDVLYDGKSIKENGQSIRVLLFKVINSGENTIKIIDYDESAPLGYSIRHGEILELPRIYGNKGYITQKVHPKLLSTTSVAFSPIILEPNDYFNVTTLVMADDATPLTIIPNGVIAGLELGTPSFHDVTKKDVPPLYIEAFAGKWQVQAFRLPLYFFTLIFLVIAVGGVLSIPRSIAFYFEDKKNRQQRIGIDNEYILKKEKKQTPIIEYILTEYSDRLCTATCN